MTGTIEARRIASRSAQSGIRRKIFCSGTAMLAVLAASAAHAQCTDAGLGGGGAASASNPTLPTSTTVAGVQALVSVLSTQNTSFLTQTSGFIGAPANPSPDLQGGGVWARGLGGSFDTRTPGSYVVGANAFTNQTGSPCNVRTFQDYGGFQAGADLARLNVDGFNIHGGVTVGYSESSIRTNSTFRADFQTPFIGIYGAVTKGSFFADGQVRWDFYQGLLSDPGSTLTSQRLDARSLSLTGNVGYQFQLPDGYFVEPSAGAVYSEVKVDRLQVGGAFFLLNSPSFAAPVSVKIEDFNSILGRASVRFGKNLVVDNLGLQPFITLSVINEFGAPVRTLISTDFGTIGSALAGPAGAALLSPFDTRGRVSTFRIGTYGQFSGGIAGQILNTGWLGYLRGDYRTGDRVDGWGVSAGIRYQFNPGAGVRSLITKGESPILPAIEGPVSWTGFSIGASAGGLWSQTRQVVDPLYSFLSSGTLERTDPHAAGVYAGGQVGLDYQFDRIVVGIAGDAGWTNARGGRGCSSGIGGNFFNCQSNIDDLFMATGRVGYASERSLFYVKGGAAFADTTDRKISNFAGQQLFIIPNQTSSAVRDFATGWTAGAGFEFAITQTLSAKAEYMHFELDRRSYLRGTPLNQGIASAEHTGDLVKVGVNYRFAFDTPVAAPVARPVIAKY